MAEGVVGDWKRSGNRLSGEYRERKRKKLVNGERDGNYIN